VEQNRFATSPLPPAKPTSFRAHEAMTLGSSRIVHPPIAFLYSICDITFTFTAPCYSTFWDPVRHRYHNAPFSIPHCRYSLRYRKGGRPGDGPDFIKHVVLWPPPNFGHFCPGGAGSRGVLAAVCDAPPPHPPQYQEWRSQPIGQGTCGEES
jgi:hypothetical protein